MRGTNTRGGAVLFIHSLTARTSAQAHTHTYTHPSVAFLPVDLAISRGQVFRKALLTYISVNGWAAEPPTEQECLTSLTFSRHPLAFQCGEALLNLHRMPQTACFMIQRIITLSFFYFIFYIEIALVVWSCFNMLALRSNQTHTLQVRSHLCPDM